jgi:hypothetical protein
MSKEEIMEAYLWQCDVFYKMNTVLHPTAEQDEADDDNVHDEGEGKSGRVTAENMLSRPCSATSEESIALKRTQDMKKKRTASDKAHKEEAKRRKALVEAVTHAITVFETIAVRGLGTVDSLQVKDLKAMPHHDDPKAPEAKGDLRDRVVLLASVNQAAAEFATVAPERATLAPTVPA